MNGRNDIPLIGAYCRGHAQQIVEDVATNTVGVFTWASFANTSADGGKNIGVVVVLLPVDDLASEGLEANRRFYLRDEMAALDHRKIEVGDG